MMPEHDVEVDQRLTVASGAKSRSVSRLPSYVFEIWTGRNGMRRKLEVVTS